MRLTTRASGQRLLLGWRAGRTRWLGWHPSRTGQRCSGWRPARGRSSFPCIRYPRSGGGAPDWAPAIRARPDQIIAHPCRRPEPAPGRTAPLARTIAPAAALGVPRTAFRGPTRASLHRPRLLHHSYCLQRPAASQSSACAPSKPLVCCASSVVFHPVTITPTNDLPKR